MSLAMMPQRSSIASEASYYPVSRQNTISSRDGSRSMRQSKRYSVTALYLSMSAKEKDLEIEDDLAKAQKALRDLKLRISTQSKRNFVLEKDGAISGLSDSAPHPESIAHRRDLQQGFFPNDEKTQKYGNLFFLLQSEPRHIAHLCRLINLSEIDSLLQTVMFTIYGNQYESREEHLLLTMFQVGFVSISDDDYIHKERTGQSYLKVILKERINSLVGLEDLDLEINPLKVYGKMCEDIKNKTGGLPPHMPVGITAEEAAANSDVQQIIQPRAQMLIEIANSFLDTIIGGSRRDPDHTICTLIGGFFFLRFINPAIISPISYMLIDKAPADNPKETLKYIAKMLQNLANKPSYAKEPYMLPLSSFLTDNRERIGRFLLDICEVQDFYESLEMDNYVALSKKDLELSISLNEVYATHALLQTHSVELVCDLNPSVCRTDALQAKDESSHLGVLLQELGVAPAQLSRKDNRAINLPLFSKWEAPLDDFTAALDITHEDVLFMEAKSTFVLILRSLPPNAMVLRRPLRLDQVAEAAATTRNDSVMVRKGIRGIELLSQLQDIRILTKDDGFALLRDEVEQELVHLGSMKEKVEEEHTRLQEVFGTIRDHNAYLFSQLETYKSYLHNVRNQSAGKTPKKSQKPVVLGPYKFTHQQLEKEGVIQKSNVPENRRANIYFQFSSPLPGTFVIALHYKGRFFET
ncbi:hypothetical protein MRB53_042350 [Persea americana]|nr:hypothetical protein MRB53_042350 [Persea americana]